MPPNPPDPAPPSGGLRGNAPEDLLARALESHASGPAPGEWTPPDPEHLSKLLPEYPIECLIGRGGMGAVYKGRQRKLDRTVAVKVLPAELAEDNEFIGRFHREAHLLASLNHPGIVTIFDFGQTAEGHLYFVMEYVEGTDLHRLIHKTKLQARQALDLTIQICDAMQYAHDKGVIHRDIKPANVLVTPDGRVKLADFGLALKPAEHAIDIPEPPQPDVFDPRDPRGIAALRFTKPGAAMGTVEYAAPEIYEGKADERSDIYALGIMLYEMLTGEPPKGYFALPSTLSKVDKRVDGVVIKALEIEPSDRYQKASDMKLAVEQATLPLPADPPPGKPPVVETQLQIIRPGPRPPGRALAVPPARGHAQGLQGQPQRAKGSITEFVIIALLFVGAGGAWYAQGHWPMIKSLLASSTGTPAFTNSLDMKFVPVPGTKVMFCIHDTRNADYATYAQTNSGVDAAWKKETGSGKDQHPVVNMSWEDAKGFCAWLSKKEGKTYRLPTDHEWSVAAGIGGQEDANATPESKNGKISDVYPWGRTYPPGPKDGNYNVARLNDGHAGLAPVMQFNPNPLGLYDMGGNVWQYCEDWYDSQRQYRVLRGGSWDNSNPANLLSSFRSFDPPTTRDNYGGFRVVLEASSVALPAPVATAVNSSPPAPSEAQATPEFTNSLGMKFVPVPGTKVLFCIHDTRNADYAAYALVNSGVDATWKTGAADQHPVVNVSWDDAKAFCTWMGRKEGKIYRLPTDHEWSVAAGIGSHEDEWATPESKNGRIAGVYPWGGTYPPGPKDGNYSISGVNDGYAGLAPVMQFRPNPLGLYDMGGNAWQWCEDWYSNERLCRVMRGGSWGSDNSTRRMLSSFRDYDLPSRRFGGASFRVVLEAGGSQLPVTPAANPGSSPNPAATVAKPAAMPAVSNGITNSLGMKFAPVPGTKVMFCIHETRNADYANYAQANGGVDAAWKKEAGSGKDQHPVTKVSWQDAREFCSWLTKKEGKTYRLPTDHEWSVAVGIGSLEDESASPATKSEKIKGVYPWGEDFPPSRAVGNLAGSEFNTSDRPSNRNTIKGYRDNFVKTAPVMSFPANKLGLYDLSGNVWEWCEDWYDSKQESRLSRGGSFGDDDAILLLSSYRHINAPAIRWDSVGFRVVLEVGGSQQPVTPAANPATSPNPATTLAKPAATPTVSNGITNSLGMKFVPVPGTKVLFCIHDTRNADYAAYAEANGGVDATWKTESGSGKDQHPVVNVSWDDAHAFCTWMGRKEGKIYRLPTDHEWSVAAGIGREDEWATPESNSGSNSGVYPWGGTYPPGPKDGNYGISGVNDGYAGLAPVMQFRPNPLGLYDMGGNAWQWCESWYSNKREARVSRGGSWRAVDARSLLSSHRCTTYPTLRYDDRGFRVVMEVGGSAVILNPVTVSPPTPPPATQPPAHAEGWTPEEQADFEKKLRAFTWVLTGKNWIMEFQDNHEIHVQEGSGWRTWHWWITGPRTLHVQFSVMPAKFDPAIGGTYVFDRAMIKFTEKRVAIGVRGKALRGKSGV